MKKKIIALALSAVCMAAECGTIPLAVTAEESHWIPQDFEEAIAFYNKYGATHIEGNIVCYVRSNYKYANEIYGLEFTENSSITEYLSQNSYEYISDEEYLTTDLIMEVDTFELPENSNLEIFTYTETASGKKYNEQTYSFFADENGNVSETDMFAWLPDCITEYNDYIAENGNVSLNENYIIYCDDVNYSTGAEIIFEQLGTAEVKEIYNGNAIALDKYPSPPGITSHKVIVYQPVSEGTVKLNWIVSRPWDMTYIDNENTNYFAVDENLSVSEIEEKDFAKPVKFDVNDDGEFNVTDVVALQKWLLCIPDAELKNWKAADVCEDEKIDVFDLCLMQKELVNTLSKPYPVENPEVIDEFTPCTATIDDDFMDWKVRVVIKCQYSVPERVWTADDFAGVENIKKVTQYNLSNPYRQVLEISSKKYSKEAVLEMIKEIEALNLEEIKEVSPVEMYAGDIDA